MPWIRQIDEAQADGALREAYDQYTKATGQPKVANILKAHSLSPESFRRHYDFYRHIAFGKGPLRRYQREMIATYVSKLNGCEY